MNEEEKAVFECLENDEGEYEELEDDFLFKANDGKLGIIVEKEYDEDRD